MKWFALFALLLSACARTAYIQPMQYRQEGSEIPIIFGSLNGLPQDYSLVLHLDFKHADGTIRKSTRAFGPPKKNDKSGISHFAYILPSGEWTVTGFEIGTTMEYQVPGRMAKVTKTMFANLKYLDSSTSIFRFATQTGRLHYLGRWEFGGLTSLENQAALKMEDFRRIVEPLDLRSEEVGMPTLSIGNHAEEDRRSFDKANSGLARKESQPTLPEVLWPPGYYRFELTVGELRDGGSYHRFNWSHQQMMKPNIPKF